MSNTDSRAEGRQGEVRGNSLQCEVTVQRVSDISTGRGLRRVRALGTRNVLGPELGPSSG